MKSIPRPRKQLQTAANASMKGFTLVELLVAMVVSLLILTAAGAVYTVARQGFQTNDDRTRTLESGRLALDILTRNIRMAGAANPDLTGDFTTWSLPDPIEPMVGVEGGALPDSITIAYVSDRAYNAARLAGSDCLGQPVGLDVVMNRFSISADNQLQCAGNGGTPGSRVVGAAQPLVGPVVDLQITYSVVSLPGGAPLEKGLKEPEDVNTTVVTADLIPVGSWNTVRAINFCIDVASFEPNTLERDPAGTPGVSPGLNCRGVAFAADGRVHRIFRATVNVRNSTRGDNRL